MLGKLIALSKNGEEKESLPVVNLHFFIGSDLFCDLRIKHEEIAAQHCLITSQKNKPALIRNLSRTVPTLVNSTEIGSSDVELKDNDIISIRHKNYKWCYNSSSTPSTSTQSGFVVTSKNRKSWPLFKNKLVAVVTPQRRDEQNEVLPKKRRGTIAEENISKTKTAPKFLAIKSGLRATNKQSLGKRKSSVKNAQNTTLIERTPLLNRKSVKFLDMSAPRSMLGKRGRKSSYVTPYKSTPAKQKISVYSTPPSSFKRGNKKPLKSILKTPNSSSSATPTKSEYDEQHLLIVPDVLATPVSNVPEVSLLNPPILLENDLLQTPVKDNQPEIVMRSSKRKAAIIRSPPSTPKSITKKRKSPEEKSIEASERAAKKLKKGPPHAIDKKKIAALLKCHRKSLTPHPAARKSGKLITKFPSSFSSRLETNSYARTKFSPKFNNSRKTESLTFSTDTLTPTVFKYSSMGKGTNPEMIIHNTTASQEKVKLGSRKNLLKSISKTTSPIVRKLTRASRAARISNNLSPKTEATDVLSALALSRRWPSPSQGEVCASSSSQDMSNLSGFKKLFCVDKTLDVRELFLEKNSESEIATEKSFQSLPETYSGRVSRRSAVLKGKQSTDKELMHSFHSEGAQDLPCSESLLSGSLSSFPSYSSTSRRSLSLKQGRKSTLSPKDINISLVDNRTEEPQSIGKETTHSRDNVENVRANSISFSRKGRRSLSALSGSSFENKNLVLSPKSSSIKLNITDETHKNSVDTNHFSSPLNGSLSKSNFSDCNVSQESLDDSSSDVSVFSLGSFNSSYHKSRSGDSLSLSQASNINVDKETFLDDSMKSEISGSSKDVRVITPMRAKAHSKGRISLRRAVLLASTPKPGKVIDNNESFLSLEVEVDKKEISICESGSNKLRINQSPSLSADIASGKLKKIMKKGKGFIAKTSSRFASLPLTTDSSILKDLSAISTSVGNLRTTRQSKVNWNVSQLNCSENLINNNMDSSVTVVSSIIQSISPSKSKITNNSHIEVQPKQDLASCVSDSPRRSRRKTEDSKIFNRTQAGVLSSSPLRPFDKKHSVKDVNASSEVSTSSANTSLGKQTRSSRRTLEPSLINDQITPKQVVSIIEDAGSRRRNNRKNDDTNALGRTQIDSLGLSSTTMSEDHDSPNGTFSSVNNSIGKHGKISKLGEGPINTQSLEKRSRSLSSLSREQVKAIETLSITENVLHLRRSSRKGDDGKISNKTQIDALTSSPLPDKTTSDKEGGGSSIPSTSPNQSVGRRGRSSKLSVGPDNSISEKSSIVKKRSRSLPSSSDDQITHKKPSTILEDSGCLRRSGRKADDGKILNKTLIDTSSSTPLPETASDKEGIVTPIIITSSNSIVGRRGRSSKLSIGPDISQLEESNIVKKRSRSLPSLYDQVTPNQASTILEDSGRPRRSSRKGDYSKVLSKSQIDASTSSPLPVKRASDKEGIVTPITSTPSNQSIGRRGRSSKLSPSPDNSQLEESNILKKRSQSLPSSYDQVTPNQASIILEDSGRLRRSSRKGDDSKILNKTIVETSLSSLPDKTASEKQGGVTPVINASPNNTLRRRGRSSTLSLCPDNSQHNALKKIASSTEDQTTPKHVLGISEDILDPRRSSRKANDSSIFYETELNASSSSSKFSYQTPNKEVSARLDSNASSAIRVVKRIKPSKVGLGFDDSCIEESSILEEHSQSTVSSADNQSTPKGPTISQIILYPRRSSRKINDGTINIKLQENISVMKSSFSDGNISSIIKVGGTPVIEASSNNSVGRRGRLSKLSLAPDNSQLEKSSIVKKRSRSLPSSSDDQITPKQASSILNNSGLPRRSSRKGDDNKLLNKTLVDASSSPPLADKRASVKEDVVTPMPVTSSNNSIGKRGRSSKLSIGPDNSILEKSNIVKKRSRSLPSSEDQVTPKQALTILEDSGRPRRSSRRGDDSKILNKAPLDSSSSSPSTLVNRKLSGEDLYATPNISTLSSVETSTGRRGRPSKLSISPDDSQLEKSTILKKHSQSLLSSSDQITPKHESSILEDPGRPRQSSRKGNDSKLLNKTLVDTSSSSPLSHKTAFDKAEVDTPITSTSSNQIVGRRGRSSKFSVAFDDSQSEKSVKKRSRSLPSSSGDQITPKQSSTIPEDSDRPRRSSRKGDNSKILNKTPLDSSSSSPSTLVDRKPSDDDLYATPNISTFSSIETRKGRNGRPSKLSIGPNGTQLEKSIVKKRSRSLPSISDQITPEQALSNLNNFGHPRRSSRKGDYSRILNKTLIDTSSSSLLPDKIASDKEDGATPVTSTSPNQSVGRRGRPSKHSVGPGNSILEKSSIVKKRSRSLPSSSGDQITPKQSSTILEDSGRPRRSSRKGDDSKTLNRTPLDSSPSSPSTLVNRKPSDEDIYATPNTSKLSDKSSSGKRGRSSKLSVGPNNSQSEKSIIVKKRSRSLPSSSGDQITPKQSSTILEDSGQVRRSSRKGDQSKISNKIQVDSSLFLSLPRKSDEISSSAMTSGAISNNALLANNGSIGNRIRLSKLSTGSTGKSEELSLIEESASQNLTSAQAASIPTPEKSHSKNESGRKSDLSGSKLSSYNPSLDDSEGISFRATSQSKFEKSKKRKVEEVALESAISFHGPVDDNTSSRAKKKVKFSNSDSFPNFSDDIVVKNETNVGYSKTFGAFSSTPIVSKTPYLINGGKSRSRSKFKNMQSPVGLSPIIGGNEPDSSVTDGNSPTSMVCLRYSKCPSYIGEGSKSDKFVFSSNLPSSEDYRSHNYIDLGVNDSSNYGTYNSNVKLSKKTATSSSTAQNELPFINQTAVTSQLPVIKEEKSLRLRSQVGKSDCSLHFLQESNKKEVTNSTSSLRIKTPIIKLSPGKNKTRSRKIAKDMESFKEKKQETSFVEEQISLPKSVSANYLSKRETESPEVSFQNELSPNLNRPTTDNKSIISPSKTSEQNVLSVKSPVPQRKGKKVFPVSQRRGRSAKNINLSPPLESAKVPTQKMSKKKKGRKTIVVEDPSSSSKECGIENIRNVSDQTISQKIKQKSPISLPKTRSKVAVLALKTTRKSVIISSPIVKSPSLYRRTAGKIRSENILSPPHAPKQGESVKEVSINVISEDQNVISLRSVSTNKEIKMDKNKVKNSSPLQKHVGSEKTNINLLPLVKRRGRSAVNNSSSRREKLAASVGTSPHLPKRGRLNKGQDNVIKSSAEGKEDIEVIEEPSTSLPLQKRGRSAVKNLDSSNKRGKSRKDPVNNNETVASPSLPKKGGRAAKVEDSNSSVSGKRTTRKASESENTSLRKGRSVVKNSDSSPNKRGKSKKVPVNINETIASPSLPKKGRAAKIQDVNLSVSGKRTARKTSVSAGGINTSLRRRRSIVNNSVSSNKRGKSKKNPVNNNEAVASPLLPKKGRAAKIEDSNSSVSGKRTTRKASESENTSLRKGRSVVKNSDSSPNKRRKSKKVPVKINETIASPSLPKKERSAKVEDSNSSVSGKRTTRKALESENTSLRRGRSVVKNSDSSSKRGKSKKVPVNINETIASPSLPKRGRRENKVQDISTDSRKKPNMEDSEIEEVQSNITRRGRSAVKDQHPLLDKRKRLITSQSESDANFNVDSTSPKRGRPVKRTAGKTSESTDNQNTLSLQDTGSPIKTSHSPPVKKEKSKKDVTSNNVAITSPSLPKRGRPAKIQGATGKGTSNNVSKSIDGQNISSSQRRGRSAAADEHSLKRDGKPKQDKEINRTSQVSSSSKKGTEPAVLENISPRRRGRTASLKQTSPLLNKKQQVTTGNNSKLPGRRGNLTSSPQPEISKVSERSKVIKKNSKIKDNRTLKSAIKKSLSKRFSRKSSLVGYIKHGRRKVHFNKDIIFINTR